jgi:hypothetical protein
MLCRASVKILPPFRVRENGGLFQEFSEYRLDAAPSHQLLRRKRFEEVAATRRQDESALKPGKSSLVKLQF